MALLTAPVLVLLIDFALSPISPAYLPGILSAGDKISVLAAGVIAGLLVGAFEELGWTEFVIPQLRLRYGVLANLKDGGYQYSAV